MKDLQDLIQVRIESMVMPNPGRIDYLLRYQETITSYNSEQDKATIEKTFMDLANRMDTEQQR